MRGDPVYRELSVAEFESVREKHFIVLLIFFTESLGNFEMDNNCNLPNVMKNANLKTCK